MLDAVVVDDEPLPRKAVVGRLEEAPGVEVAAACGSGEEAVEAVDENRPDLLFLDIHMPGMDGFETLERIRERCQPPVVVFVTAHDEHAVRAFEAHALDYVLKPVDGERFSEALERAKEEVERRARSDFGERVAALLDGRSDVGGEAAGDAASGEASAPEGPGPGAGTDAPESAGPAESDRLVVRKSGRVLFVDVESIDWIEAADNYVRLHRGDESHLVRRTMKEMEERLAPAGFFRIHRSAIVNLDRIAALEAREHGDYDVVLEDGTRLKLSRSREGELEERIGQDL